jgi:uncharacterized membrane protein
VAVRLSVAPAHIGPLLAAVIFGFGFTVIVMVLLVTLAGIAHGLLLVTVHVIALPFASVADE